MSGFELLLGGLFVLGGLRSLWVWFGRPFDSPHAKDHALFALYVAARAGLWFAFAGLFAGFAIVDDPVRSRWYVMVPICLSAVQLLAGFALGQRGTD